LTSEPTGSGQLADRAHVIASGDSLAAKRYAIAAFELAQEHGGTATWQSALRQIAEFMGDPEVRRVLENSRVGQEPKLRLVAAALADLPALPLNLGRLLVRKNRTNLAPEIAAQFDQLLETQRGVSRAHATTAIALGDTERASLTGRLREQTGGDVILETSVDPSLLGGVIVQIGDRLIDASTRTKLRALRSSLVNAV
jgi:F-type H+-transporting ATPase subunit delta